MSEMVRLPDVEIVAAKVHEAWMEAKRAQGVTSRPSEWGEEQMVPYAELSERAKDLDRATVRSVFDAVRAALVPVCCGQPMYECEAEHTDGKRYWHCRGCATNRELKDAP